MEGLRVIADDLTGACDVAAALLPWPTRVVVAIGGGPVDGLRVVNTASRTLQPREAAARVAATLADGGGGIVLKKVDTGLRGPLGAEIDAAMDAAGATEAFVALGIPESGRTTVGGVQLADGVPVDRTDFARDPENPVADARVGRAIETTSRRRTAGVPLDALRRGAAAGAIAAARAEGATIVVFDVETAADLAAAVDTVLDRARPLLLVGSTGLARALRGALVGASDPPAAVRAPGGGRGVLAIVGSVHPVACGQVTRVEAGGTARVVSATVDADAVATAVAAGEHAVLVTGSRTSADALAAVVRTARAIVRRTAPGGLVLMGGETAYRVLAALEVEALDVIGAPAPLVVRSRAVGGPLDGVPVITKGGSSGGPEGLVAMIREAAA